MPKTEDTPVESEVDTKTPEAPETPETEPTGMEALAAAEAAVEPAQEPEVPVPADDPEPTEEPTEEPAQEPPVGTPSDLDLSPMSEPEVELTPAGEEALDSNAAGWFGVELRVPPSIGGIVHYFENSAAQPYAALITEVGVEGVKLVVFKPTYTQHLTAWVPYIDDITVDGPAWKWQGLVPLGSPPPLANSHFSADQFPGATGTTIFGEPRR